MIAKEEYDKLDAERRGTKRQGGQDISEPPMKSNIFRKSKHILFGVYLVFIISSIYYSGPAFAQGPGHISDDDNKPDPMEITVSGTVEVVPVFRDTPLERVGRGGVPAPTGGDSLIFEGEMENRGPVS